MGNWRLGANGAGKTTCVHGTEAYSCTVCRNQEKQRLAIIASEERERSQTRFKDWERLPLLGTTNHHQIENFDGESGKTEWMPIPAFCRLYPFPFRVRGDRASNDPSSPDLNLR